MRCSRYCLLGLQLIACSLMLTGCASWNDWGKAKDYVAWPLSRFSKDYQNPQRLAAIWSPDVMTMPGKPAARGFGGRIYFYNEKSVPVPVKGELIVYGYEETTSANPEVKKSAPDRKFKFEKEQFAERFSKSDLGASYSVWIPWDDAGGPIKRITLIPIFKMEDGNLVHGDAAELTLPGKTPGPVMATSQSYPAVGVALNTNSSMTQMGVQQRQIAPSSNFNGTMQTQAISNSGQPIQQFPANGQQQMPSMPANYNSTYPVQSSNHASPNGYQNQVNTAFASIPVQGAVNPTTYGNAYLQPMGVQQAQVGANNFAGMVSNQAIQASHYGMGMQNQFATSPGMNPLPASGLKTTTIQLPNQVANRLADSNGTVTSFPQASYPAQGAMSYPAASMTIPAAAYNTPMPGAPLGPQMAASMPGNALQPSVASMGVVPFTGQVTGQPMTMTASGYPATPGQLKAMALRGSTEVATSPVVTQGSTMAPTQFANTPSPALPQMPVANPIGAGIPGQTLPTQVINGGVNSAGMPMIQATTGSQPQLQSLPVDSGPRKRQARAR